MSLSGGLDGLKYSSIATAMSTTTKPPKASIPMDAPTAARNAAIATAAQSPIVDKSRYPIHLRTPMIRN